jgi:anti-sigma28 factor (negative regulator of flagellin synthesis)
MRINRPDVPPGLDVADAAKARAAEQAKGAQQTQQTQQAQATQATQAAPMADGLRQGAEALQRSAEPSPAEQAHAAKLKRIASELAEGKYVVDRRKLASAMLRQEVSDKPGRQG